MTSAHMRAVITSRRELTPDLWILRLRPEQKLEFVPGQYVAVGLRGPSRLTERPYSIASSPHDPELEFFLERVEDGELSPQLYELPVGSEVYVRRQAKGRLVFDRNSGRRDHFMVATVTGVAPFVSMIRTLAAEAQAGAVIPYRIALLHAASRPEEFGYLEELTELARRYDWFRYIPTVSRPWQAPGWKGERGRAEDVARKYLDQLGFCPEGTVVYLCGNPNMIVNLEGLLLRAGFDAHAIRREMYWPSGAPVGPHSA